jgi:adenosylcobinamide hydrolase
MSEEENRDGDSVERREDSAVDTVGITVDDDVLQVHRPGTEWLSTGANGGRSRAGAAYNITVPTGWDRTDLAAYVEQRLGDAGFDEPGPALLTGVDLKHTRIARHGPVTVAATAGISNPAQLLPDDEPGDAPVPGTREREERETDERAVGRGTVNVVAYVGRAVSDGALANLIAVVAEAKAVTLFDAAGFPGTTTDAVVVGCNPGGDPARFSGSATLVGGATRACVRDAVRASLASRYAGTGLPASVADSEYGVVTDLETEVSEP